MSAQDVLSIRVEMDQAKLINDWKILGKKIETDLSTAYAKAADALIPLKHMDKFKTQMNALMDRMSQAKRGNNEEEYRFQKKLHDTELKQLNKISNRRMKAAEEVGSIYSQAVVTSAKAGEAFGTSIKDIFTDLTSKDIPSMAQAFSKLGSGAQKAKIASKANEDDSGLTKGIKKLGGVVGKLAPALIAIGAIAAGFAAIAAVLISVDNQAKQWNKTLLENGAAIGDLADGYYDVSDALDTVRKAAGDVKNNMKWGTVAEDQIKLFASYAEAGFTLKEMRTQIQGATTDMEAYQKATSAALLYSKLLGESAGDMAKSMATYMEELGLTLDGVKSRFGAIYDAAVQSGYGTKRFFGMVLQATSGMSLYNIRLEEAAGMLMQLTKILGSQAAPDFFKSLTKRFTEEGFTARLKRIVMTGQPFVQEMVSMSADATAKDFARKLGEGFKGSETELASALNSAFKRAGVEFDVEPGQISAAGERGSMGKEARAEIGQKILKAIQAVDLTKRDMLLADLQKTLPDEMGRQMSQLVDVSRGSTGKLTDLAVAIKGLEPGAKLAMELKRAATLLKAPVHELKGLEPAAFEALTGISGEQLHILQEVSKISHGQYEVLQDVQKEAQRTGVMTEDGVKLAATYGATVAKIGDKWEIVGASIVEGAVAVGDEQIKSYEQFMLAQGNRFSDAIETPMSKQEAAALQVARNTTEMAKYLQIGVEYFLDGIFGSVRSILSWMTPGLEPAEQKIQQQMISSLEDQNRQINNTKGEILSQIGDLERERDTSQGGKRLEVESKIETLRATMDRMNLIIEANTKRQEIAQQQTKSFDGRQGLEAVVNKELLPEILPAGVTNVARDGKRTTTTSAQAINVEKAMEIFLKTQGEAGQEKLEELAQSALASSGILAKFQEEMKMLASVYLSEEDYQAEAEKILAKTLESDEARNVVQVRQAGYLRNILIDYRKIARTLDELPKETAKALVDKERAEKARTLLEAAGVGGTSEQLDKMAQGMALSGNISAQLVRALGKSSVAQEFGEMGAESLGPWMRQIRALVPGEKMNDFILRFGASGVDAMRIDSGDVLTGMKPGGAIDQKTSRGLITATEGGAGAQGGVARGAGAGQVTNIYHMYNDGPGVLRNIEKAQKAGVIS